MKATEATLKFLPALAKLADAEINFGADYTILIVPEDDEGPAEVHLLVRPEHSQLVRSVIEDQDLVISRIYEVDYQPVPRFPAEQIPTDGGGLCPTCEHLRPAGKREYGCIYQDDLKAWNEALLYRGADADRNLEVSDPKLDEYGCVSECPAFREIVERRN